MSLNSSRRIQKSLIKEKWIDVGKVIYSRKNYCKIKITEESIQQKQLLDNYIQKIKITALK